MLSARQILWGGVVSEARESMIEPRVPSGGLGASDLGVTKCFVHDGDSSQRRAVS